MRQHNALKHIPRRLRAGVHAQRARRQHDVLHQHARIQIQQQIFPTPPHAKYGAINECLRLRTQRPAQGLAHAYRFDTCSCNKIGKTQSGNFYFG